MYILFFFFQAEDGIRDYKVTGVQTCALPISMPPAPIWPNSMYWPTFCSKLVAFRGTASKHSESGTSSIVGCNFATQSSARSEERRVGKECRCRWAADR